MELFNDHVNFLSLTFLRLKLIIPKDRGAFDDFGVYFLKVKVDAFKDQGEFFKSAQFFNQHFYFLP